MELLIARRLARRIGGQPLFEGVDLRLNAGDRLGLVGPNGSGKSTLLRTLAGLEAPDDGSLRRAPGARVGYLPQRDALPGADGGRSLWQVARGALAHLDELERRMRDEERRIAAGEERAAPYAAARAEFERLGGFAAEASLRATLAAFGFTAADDERQVDTLSAGERRRLALVVALASAPDLLLLDEPTNHLDLATRQDLARTLAAWRGALVVVSHDRALLEAGTNRTAFLEPSRPAAGGAGRLVVEKGAYAVARARREGALRAGHKREAERLREARRLEAMAAELATFGRKAQARKRAAERRRSQLLAGTGAAIATEPSRPRLAPRLGGATRGRRSRDESLLDARHLTAAGVFADLTVRLGRGQRIALLGPNGSGKSTLLGLLAGLRPSDDPRAELRYRPALKLRLIDQAGRGLQEEPSVGEQAEELVGRAEAGRLLAGAGLAPRSWSNLPRELSGGERARAGLALTLTGDADLWLLDEPTNDLDLAAVEALEEQLAEKLAASGAALLLATHDRRLAERLTTEVWSIVDGALERYAGVGEYLAGAALGSAEQGEGEGVEAPTAMNGAPAEAERPDRRTAGVEQGVEQDVERAVAGFEEERALLLRLRDERTDLTERDLHRLEARLAALEEELMTAYAARLPLAAPRYRLREHGFTLFADDLTDLALHDGAPAGGTEARLAVVIPVPGPDRPGAAPLASSGTPAATATEALAGLARGTPPESALRGCAAAWLELRLVGDVGHLRLVERADACAVPVVRAAFADAGARLAFTRLGAGAVQLHHPAPLPGTLLTPAGDDWWSLGLGEFLTLEGWRT